MSDDHDCADRVEHGMNASSERLTEGMRAEGKGMTASGQGGEQPVMLAPVAPPPPPTDAATSARPKGAEK